MVARMRYRVAAFGISDIGLVRHNNEDYWAAIPEINFYVLADGMGGHRAGEVAAQEAVKSLCSIVKKSLMKPEAKELSLEEVQGIIGMAIEHCNAVVYQMGRSDYALRGMGTTLCCLLFHPTGLICGHVGDSRIYRLRSRTLEQITRDHSLLFDLVETGQLDERQASEFMYKNIITKAVGTESFLEPSVHIQDLQQGDIYLMCTDGLSDMLSAKDIEIALNMNSSLEETGHRLVNTANARGGYDNVTVVLTKVEKENASKDLSR